MLDYNFTSDQLLYRDTTRDFLGKEAPLTKVRELSTTERGFDPAWWRRGAELGWTSMLISPGLGGESISGNGLVDTAIVAEEMGRLVSPGPFVPVNVVALALSYASTAAAHQEVVEALMAGEATASWAVYEPGRGWDTGAIELTAAADGDGFVLNGVKDRVESGDQADHLLVTARTAEGLAQFLVPADAPGVTVTGGKGLDLVRRFATVRFDNTRVPASSQVGTVAETGAAAGRQLQAAVVLQCAEMAGAAERALEFTIQWGFDRYSFGRPLASYQALKHRYADMKLWVEAMFATTSAAARAVGMSLNGDASPDKAAELASVAKAYVGERATDILQDCVQLHGGIGVTWEHDIHLYLRRVTVDRVTWGTPSEHRRLLADILSVKGDPDE
jgi:alkylation response protein AidB-like acyl-CoA dehydrogenase